MSRYALRGVVTDIYGNSIPYATVTVKDENGALVTVYETKTGGTANTSGVVVSDSVGRYVFYVESDTYPYPTMFNLTFTKTGYTVRVEQDVMP